MLVFPADVGGFAVAELIFGNEKVSTFIAGALAGVCVGVIGNPWSTRTPGPAAAGAREDRTGLNATGAGVGGATFTLFIGRAGVAGCTGADDGALVRTGEIGAALDCTETGRELGGGDTGPGLGGRGAGSAAFGICGIGAGARGFSTGRTGGGTTTGIGAFPERLISSISCLSTKSRKPSSLPFARTTAGPAAGGGDTEGRTEGALGSADEDGLSLGSSSGECWIA